MRRQRIASLVLAAIVFAAVPAVSPLGDTTVVAEAHETGHHGDCGETGHGYRRQTSQCGGCSGTYDYHDADCREAGWRHDGQGWCYRNADGTCPRDCWQEIGGSRYYFDGNGYRLSDTVTPDGCRVDCNGVCIR